MNQESNDPALPVSMREGVNVLLDNARKDIRRRYQKCENHVRESPAASVLGAFAAGYLLHRMPVRAILITQIRVLSALAPPALFLLGAAGLYEFLTSRKPAGDGRDG